MDAIKQLNTVNSSNATQTSLASVSMRELFLNWLVDGNAKKYSVEEILSCLDKISDYSIQKKISSVSIWGYMKFNVFKPVFNKLLNAKLLRVTDCYWQVLLEKFRQIILLRFFQFLFSKI